MDTQREEEDCCSSDANSDIGHTMALPISRIFREHQPDNERLRIYILSFVDGHRERVQTMHNPARPPFRRT